MLFTSTEFFFLLLLTFLIYYFPLVRKSQRLVLLISSFVFYAWHTPSLVFLLILSLGINAFISIKIAHGALENTRFFLKWGVVVNLLFLFVFKYMKLFLDTFLFSTTVPEWVNSIVLPIGISFYTFQGISLVVDVYFRRKNNIDNSLISANIFKNFINTGFYISFFPQLIAGPIMRSFDFLPQIKDKFFNDIDWYNVVSLLILGYFLKMFVADNLKDITFYLDYPRFTIFSAYTLIMLMFAYSIQIFADFAGYSIIALGLAGLFGYKLVINFNFPYVAISFSDFWKRWHISLSTWLRDYLYIPLGGNKKGFKRTYLNLFLVMFLGGLWHGAAWSYAIWGTFHGILLAIERLINNYILIKLSGVTKYFKMIFVFILVTFAWLLFKMPNFEHVIVFLKCIVNNWEFSETSKSIEVFILLFSFPVVAYHLLYLFMNSKNTNIIFKDFVLAMMLFLTVFSNGLAGEFIYFQF